MKNAYFCKCGRIVRKSTDADNTGNRDVKGCTGCPYLLPYGEQEYIKGEGFHLKVKGYECRVSKRLEYASLFSGCVSDMGTCYVVSLDYDFLEEISEWIKENYPEGELSGGFSRESIRPTDFSINGRYKYPIYCAKNKKGMAAKAALKEHFFEDRRRKDMTRDEEERRIKDLIENGKRAAQGAAAEAAQTSAVPEEKMDIRAAENQIFVNPDSLKFRIGTIKNGKKTCWRTEHMENGEWLPNNVSFYEEFENAQGEFAAWIRTESLVPMKPENEDPAVTTALPAAPMAADTDGTTEALATVPEALPAFDYSGLDAETAMHLQNLAQRALESKQRYYLDMMEIVFEAHRELCDTVVQRLDNGQFDQKESTFRAWCASIGIGRSTAYNLLQVQALMDNSTPEEQEVLEQAPAKLLYAAAKPSAPAEAVAAVKSGDITTYKEYQEMATKLKAAEQRATDIEKELDDMIAENDDHIAKLFKTREQLEAKEREARDANNAKEMIQQSLNQAINERDAARDMLEKAKRRANHLVQERDDALEHLDAVNSEMDELRARPIEVAVAEPDPAEIERLASEKAEGIAAQRTAELKAQVDKLQQAQENRAQDAENLKMQDYDTVLFAISTIQSAWRSAGPAFRRLDEQCREQLRRNLRERIAEIEKAVSVC